MERIKLRRRARGASDTPADHRRESSLSPFRNSREHPEMSHSFGPHVGSADVGEDLSNVPRAHQCHVPQRRSVNRILTQMTSHPASIERASEEETHADVKPGGQN